MLRRRLASPMPTTAVPHLALLQCASASLQFSGAILKPDCHFDSMRAYSSTLLSLNDLRGISVLSRWRNILIIKSTIAQYTRIATAASPTTSLASFHSTNAFSDKWKIKFSCDVKRDQQPPKNYIRYAVQEKRSDTKKALKSILFNGRCLRSTNESFPGIKANYADQLNKKSRITRQARRAYHKKLKRKLWKEIFSEDFDDNPDRIFHAAFGTRGFTWTFRPSEMGFDWTENYRWSNGRFSKQGSSTESGDKSFIVGTYAERKILGLPTAGPLEIEDVKAAFRVSALKWHPDKNQGSSKADAEEKFKHCVDAYKSLCNTLSAAA